MLERLCNLRENVDRWRRYTEDFRNTPSAPGGWRWSDTMRATPFVASESISRGHLVAWDAATGLPRAAVPGSRVFGFCAEDVDAGSTGFALTGLALLDNSESDPCSSVDAGLIVYAENSGKVSRTTGGSGYPAAGVLYEVTADNQCVVLVGQVASLLWSTPGTSQIWNGLSRVDPWSGNDGTAVPFDPTRPFATLQAAVDAHMAEVSPLTTILVVGGQFDHTIIKVPTPIVGAGAQTLKIIGIGSGTQLQSALLDCSEMIGFFRLEFDSIMFGWLKGPTGDLLKVDMATGPAGRDPSVIVRECYFGATAPTGDCVHMTGGPTGNGSIELHNCTIFEDGSGAQGGIRADNGTIRAVGCQTTLRNAPAITCEGTAKISTPACQVRMTNNAQTAIVFDGSESLDISGSKLSYDSAPTVDVIAGTGTGTISANGASFYRHGSAFGVNCPNANADGFPFDPDSPLPRVTATVDRTMDSGAMVYTANTPGKWPHLPADVGDALDMIQEALWP